MGGLRGADRREGAEPHVAVATWNHHLLAAALGRPIAGGYETNDALSGEYRRPREYHETSCTACGGPA